ncbi:MAG TPA: 3-phosphoserine/phosphohydroxythreonine transaminase [bacterium]|nr:3-phosphoserine/phosphohydroxythreonine transaminase [bacterium]HOL47328.1 3-phosphoserine/phosphohydroxythreonine transaminase [bacterium]HPQ17966.1 3-phosphoserine/phosphohydroxythreonine transaminase [bacterium]
MSKKRPYNLNPGPAILPLEVMEQAQRELLDLKGIGLSVLEISHRSKDFEEINNSAEQGIRKNFGVPDNYSILFLQGGASLQFGMIPMNFLNGGVADYVDTGAWAGKAIKEAKLFGTVNIAGSSKDKNYNYIPQLNTLKFSSNAKYVHITSNETIGGIQWQQYPDTGNIPLIADMSSDIMSRKIDIKKFALIYAGAQKNIGPSGVTVVIIRNDLLDKENPNITTMLKYSTHAKEKSLYNTPPTFGIYLIDLVMKWMERIGGLEEVEKRNNKKAEILYKCIDESDFYNGTAERHSRSKMNITFRLPSEELEEKFVKEAKAAGFIGLKGHRSVGGCRASLYNAFTIEGVEELVDFMIKFEKNNS